MRVLEQVPFDINSGFMAEQYKSMLYDLDDQVLDHVRDLALPGSTVILFSGAQRLTLEGIYIEPRQFRSAFDQWPNGTLFVDTGNEDLLLYTLQKLCPQNLLILNSVWFSAYRHWVELKDHVTRFSAFARRSIITIPLDRFDWNRLRYSDREIASMLGGCVVNRTLIICR